METDCHKQTNLNSIRPFLLGRFPEETLEVEIKQSFIFQQKSVQIGRFQIGSFRSQYPVMKQTCRVFGIMSTSLTSMIN